MTQRIFSLVCLLLVVFHFKSAAAQDDLTLDDSFSSEAPVTSPTEGSSATPLDAAVNSEAPPTAVPAETDELSLDSEMKDAAAPPAEAPSPIESNPLDTIVDGKPSQTSEESFAAATPSQSSEQSENVNLASPVELRQREGALYGFSAGLIFSSQALQEKYNVSNTTGSQVTGTTRVDRQSNNIQHVGFMIRYAETPYYRIGTDINISYSKSQNHNSVTVKDTQSLDEITTLKGELNLSYAIEMGALPIYFLGGLGYEQVTGNSIGKIINSAGIGGQVGGGFVINSTINLEAMYSYYLHRLSNAMTEGYGVKIPKLIDTEKARIINQGLIVRGTFSFNY